MERDIEGGQGLQRYNLLLPTYITRLGRRAVFSQLTVDILMDSGIMTVDEDLGRSSTGSSLAPSTIDLPALFFCAPVSLSPQPDRTTEPTVVYS